MGDRCTLVMTFRESDGETVKRVCGDWNSESPNPDLPGCLQVEFEQVDGGAQVEREDLAAQGVPFFGHHYAGCDYGPSAFAACGGRMEEIDADHLGQPVVHIDTVTGEPTDDDRRMAGEYVERLRLVRAELAKLTVPG